MKTLTQLLSLAALLAASFTSVASCPGPCNLRLHDGPTPYLVYVRWDAPTNAVAQYLVYRNGLQVARMNAADFLAFPLFYDPYLQPNHSYTYQVVATFTNGTVSLPSNPLLVVTPAPTPVIGTNTVVNLLVRFGRRVGLPPVYVHVHGRRPARFGLRSIARPVSNSTAGF